MKRGLMSRLLKWMGGLLLILVIAVALVQFARESVNRLDGEAESLTSSEPVFPAAREFEAITIPLSLPEEAKPLEMIFIPAGAFLMGSPGRMRKDQGRLGVAAV